MSRIPVDRVRVKRWKQTLHENKIAGSMADDGVMEEWIEVAPENRTGG
jgi:hypothetical protein